MEQVFVVRRTDFFAGQWPQGFVPWHDDEARALTARFERLGFFLPRAEAEEDPSHKQLIPYCVLVRGGEVFCVHRTSAQGERRLHGKLSIGIGGHVNPPDLGPGPEPQGLLAAALRRELDEELAVPWDRLTEPPRLLGLLNDDGNPVGAVHAGLVYLLSIPVTKDATDTCIEVSVRETSAMHGGFGHLAEPTGLWQDRARFETWSRILLEAGVIGPMALSPPTGATRIGPESVREETSNG